MRSLRAKRGRDGDPRMTHDLSRGVNAAACAAKSAHDGAPFPDPQAFLRSCSGLPRRGNRSGRRATTGCRWMVGYWTAQRPHACNAEPLLTAPRIQTAKEG